MEINVTPRDFDAMRSLLETQGNVIMESYIDSMSGANEIETLISQCEAFFTIEDLLTRFHESTGVAALLSEDIHAKYDFAQSIR